MTDQAHFDPQHVEPPTDLEEHTYASPIHEEVENHIDPAVAEAVHSVRDRFGAGGLRDLITLARYELDVTEQAAAALRSDDFAEDGLPGDGSA